MVRTDDGYFEIAAETIGKVEQVCASLKMGLGRKSDTNRLLKRGGGTKRVSAPGFRSYFRCISFGEGSYLGRESAIIYPLEMHMYFEGCALKYESKVQVTLPTFEEGVFW